MTGETTGDLLREARAAMDEYDPEDGQPADSPAWRLLIAVETLDRALVNGGALPTAWHPARVPYCKCCADNECECEGSAIGYEA